MPPRPQMRLHLEKHNPVTLQTFYGILYRFDISNKWENVIQDYIKIELLDYECPENRYRLEAASGNQVRYREARINIFLKYVRLRS